MFTTELCGRPCRAIGRIELIDCDFGVGSWGQGASSRNPEEESGMLLSDKRIMQAMADGNIIIEPFEPRQLGTNSYDVRLGAYYYTPNHNMVTVNFTDEDDAKSFWLGPYYAEDGLIKIRPGDTILA